MNATGPKETKSSVLWSNIKFQIVDVTGCNGPIGHEHLAQLFTSHLLIHENTSTNALAMPAGGKRRICRRKFLGLKQSFKACQSRSEFRGKRSRVDEHFSRNSQLINSESRETSDQRGKKFNLFFFLTKFIYIFYHELLKLETVLSWLEVLVHSIPVAFSTVQ